MVYKFSGKPSGNLALSSKYKGLDVSVLKPPKDGVVTHLLYINVKEYKLVRNTPCGCCQLPGRIRVRLVREAWKGQEEDPTAYLDIPLLPGFSDWLTTFVYFESAEAGRPCHWEFRADHASATLGTRYCKYAQ